MNSKKSSLESELCKTNSLPLKIDSCKTTFLLGFGLFSGDMLVLGIFREGKLTSRIR